MATSRRRRFLADAAGLLAGAWAPLASAAPDPRRRPAVAAAGDESRIAAPDAVFAATWAQDGHHFAGVLAALRTGVEMVSRHQLPTRAHGLAVEPQGTILLVARRPGDWLLRLDPRSDAIVAWNWSDGDFVYNGHVLRSGDGRRLFTTETSLETGAGSIGVRDARSLGLLARWPTGGIDPHELVSDSDGALWVANGGIETRPETGRTKHGLERMDSSLVRLDAASGRITGQWRLDDRRLGLRHLAVTPAGTIAIALQSEHEDDQARQAAPVLALWDRRRGLRPVPSPSGSPLAGYGGSVAALGSGIAVSCPRAGKVARWHLAGGEAQWQAPVDLPEACPIAAGWAGGAGAIVDAGAGAGRAAPQRLPLDSSLRLDNHWVLVTSGGASRRS